MRDAARKLTYADYEKIPDDAHRHEIIEGEEYMTPAPEVVHQRVSGKLEMILAQHVSKRSLGEVLHAPLDVVLSDEDIVQPDIVFVSTARSNAITAKNIQGPPDLVVEILSPPTAAVDRGPKLSLYERSGVAEYWIVDPAAKTIELREFGRPRRTRVYREGQTFESALLPGLAVSVSELF